MLTITGFADEISPDLEEQMKVMASEGLSHIELRGVNGKNVLQLTDEDVREVKQRLDARGFRISSIGSPIGKADIRDDFAAELERMKRACELAATFHTPYIRVFSYFIPEGEEAALFREEVVGRMNRLIELAEAAQVTLLLENESKVYGDTDERCLDLLSSCEHPRLRMAFDPGNFVRNGVKPVSEALPKLRSYMAYVHVKDASAAGNLFVPAGEGDGELAPFVRSLKDSGYSGYLSVEPHLQKHFPEMDNPGRFVYAVRALKKLLQAEGLAWN